MKFLILDSQINFFKENGFIEFESFFSEDSLQILENEIDSIFKTIKSLSFFEQYIALRDLFRKSNIIKKIVFDKNLASIAKTLTNKRSFRLLFDQAILTNKPNLFESSMTLDDSTSFQGTACYLLIKLDNTLDNESVSFPKKKGSLMFFKSLTSQESPLINLKELYSSSGKFLLIGYGDLKSLYKFNDKDPHPNHLKTLGYSFGDILKDEFHPTVF